MCLSTTCVTSYLSRKNGALPCLIYYIFHSEPLGTQTHHPFTSSSGVVCYYHCHQPSWFTYPKMQWSRLDNHLFRGCSNRSSSTGNRIPFSTYHTCRHAVSSSGNHVQHHRNTYSASPDNNGHCNFSTKKNPSEIRIKKPLPQMRQGL